MGLSVSQLISPLVFWVCILYYLFRSAPQMQCSSLISIFFISCSLHYNSEQKMVTWFMRSMVRNSSHSVAPLLLGKVLYTDFSMSVCKFCQQCSFSNIKPFYILTSSLHYSILWTTSGSFNIVSCELDQVHLIKYPVNYIRLINYNILWTISNLITYNILLITSRSLIITSCELHQVY